MPSGITFNLFYNTDVVICDHIREFAFAKSSSRFRSKLRKEEERRKNEKPVQWIRLRWFFVGVLWGIIKVKK